MVLKNITRYFSRAGYYTMGEQLDYPSVSHISSVAQVQLITFKMKTVGLVFGQPKIMGKRLKTTSKDGNFNIVFAIKKDYESAYKALARCLEFFHIKLKQKFFQVRSLVKRTLQCWSRTRRTSSTWWRAAMRGSPPPSRCRSSAILTISDI